MNWRKLITFTFLFALTSSAAAAKLHFQLTNQAGLPVSNAVISLTPSTPQPTQKAQPSLQKVRQRNREFLPYVLPVQRNTPIVFPNEDPFQHHVYSFSATKRFEVKLFSGMNKTPIIFDQIGVATLGCNIHDWMIGYIVVVDTPYFDKSNAAGQATFNQLPAETYRVDIWHPQLSKTLTLTVTLARYSTQTLTPVLTLTKPPKPHPPSADSTDDFDYNNF